MDEIAHNEQPKSGEAWLVWFTLLLFSSSYVFSYIYDNVWIALIGIGISSFLVSILGRDKEHSEKSAEGGFAVFIAAMALWVTMYTLFVTD